VEKENEFVINRSRSPSHSRQRSAETQSRKILSSPQTL
jgi:hypothetical protein